MTLYHATDVELPVGELLIPMPGGFVVSEEVSKLEELFEAARPEGGIARGFSTYACRSPFELDAAGGREGLVYEVEPVGEIQWSDLAWYTEAQMALEDGDLVSAKTYAQFYWSGEPFPIKDQQLPEARCRALRIQSVYEPPEPDDVTVPGVPVLQRITSRVPLPAAVIEQLLVTPECVMVARGQDSERATGKVDMPDGSVSIWGYGDRRDWSVQSLETLTGERLQSTLSSEAEQRIKQHPSYARYRALTESGSVPPPIYACQLPDGRIQSSNRRRLLVAQETGTPLRAWLERLNPDTTVVTYGQFQDVMDDIYAEMTRPQGRVPSGHGRPHQANVFDADMSPHT